MSLGFRLFSVGYTFSFTAFALFVLAVGILGRKIRWGYLAVFWGCSFVVQGLVLGVQLILYVMGINPEIISYSIYDLVCYTVTAVILGGLLCRTYRLPFLHTLTASVLSTFIILTAGSVITDAVQTYSPLFDRQHFLVFIHFYVPYTVLFGLACLAALILRKSEFYRYFSAMFRSRARAVLTLLVSYALMCTLPVIGLISPDAAPDAGYAMFFFALIVAGLFLIQFTAMYVAGQDRIKAQEETILQQQAHMALLEELQQEIRAFRHDVTNLFSGLTLQAQEGDLAGIQDFMKKTSSYFDEKLGSEIAQMDGLNNVGLYPLRSLLTTKLAKMRQENVRAVLEVLHPVHEEQSMDVNDLLRCVGILLDNAVEAAAGQDGLVRIVLLQEEKELYLAIANNYDAAPNLSALTRKGYTTKGKGHGTGLSSYRKIVSRYKGCATRTYLKDDMFVQELHIPAV